MRQRKEALNRVYREAERKEHELSSQSVPRFAVGRSVGGVFAMVMVLAVVGALLVSRSRQTFTPRVSNLPERTAARESKVLRIALERFKRDIGHYPTAEEGGLKALIYDTGHWEWRRAYVTMIKPDPWGTHYFYESTTNGMILLSCGPDKTPHTRDDIIPPAPTSEEVESGSLAAPSS